MINNGNMKCEFCGDTKSSRYYVKNNMLVCNKHSQQFDKYGFFKERTRFDKNNIIIEDGYAKIILYDTHGKEVSHTTIDISDVDKVKDIKWYRRINGNTQYCYGKIKGNTVMLHRFLLGTSSSDIVVDHIDGNGLNNTRSNLRECSHKENIRNMHKDKIIGVNFDEKRGKYIASITVDYKNIFLGRFNNIEDAIEARLKAEKHYFKEFSSQTYSQ